MNTAYDLKETDSIETPALLYYPDIIEANTKKAIEIAGDASRLWPHVKTHKMPAIVTMQLRLGITRFKCATIAEAEMIASCGAKDILLAYPLVGPSISRLLRLSAIYKNIRFWAVADDLGLLRELGRQAVALGVKQRVLVDVDIGMHRTGVPPERLEEFYLAGTDIQGVELLGIHAYDGHINQSDPILRRAEIDKCANPVHTIRSALSKRGMPCEIAVMGGTPTFSRHAETPGVFLSPGTIFVHDHSYQSRYADLPFIPGATIATRVISHTAPGTFTIDLGHKAIAADPAGARGFIVNLPEAEPDRQSEEHWVFRLSGKSGAGIPGIGETLYVIPAHICPTTALYPAAWAIRDGEAKEQWEVTARNRKITV